MWRNGLVTFGVESLGADLSKPTLTFSAVDAEYFMAPLWFPSGISTLLVNSTVSWQQQREGESGFILDLASEAVGNYSKQQRKLEPTEFKPTWAIIVDWNVTLAPSIEERFRVCSDYRVCLCLGIDDLYPDGESPPEASGDSSGCVPDPDCHSNLGWSPAEIEYLGLLCAPHQTEILHDYRTGVRPHLCDPLSLIRLL